jgi:negative regulator of flagellin synthesis FlgM
MEAPRWVGEPNDLDLSFLKLYYWPGTDLLWPREPLLMQIHGIQQTHGPHGLGGPHFARANQATPSTSQVVDQLDISAAAQAASLAEGTQPASDIRADLVARLRGEIAAGTYETTEKLDAAISRLLDTLG